MVRENASEDGERKPSLLYGLASGTTVATVLNPYDRALYLSVKERRPFLHTANFRNPYLGFLQSLSHRALSGGLFFPLEHALCAYAEGPIGNFAAGSLAGSIGALVLSPLAAVKYRRWGTEENNFTSTARAMYKSGGARSFMFGLVPTVARDAVFGCVYTGGRHLLWSDSTGNMVAAVVATIASAPFNLARNAQFATAPQDRPPSIRRTMRALLMETKSKQGLSSRFSHIQQRLTLGWGTTRVGLGMALGAQVYERLVRDDPLKDLDW
jgi:hypothetical protein